jgi:DNA-binding NtrC family response regulator
MERAVLLTHSGELSAEQLSLPGGYVASQLANAGNLPVITLEAAELQLIQQAMAQCHGHKQKAADLLGITKSSLYRRLEKYDLAH